MKKNGLPFKCRALLMKISEGKGEAKCWRCGHMNKFEIHQAQ